MTEDSQNLSEEEVQRRSAQNSDPNSEDNYDLIPRSASAKSDDKKIILVRKWHNDLQRPSNMSDTEYTTFLRYCLEFFVDSENLWRKDSHGAHKIVVIPNCRMEVMRGCHDDIGHKGFYATRATIMERFWWPHMHPDIVWFVRTCHLCQLRQTRQVLIPPVVATPAPLFTKVYVDTMHMPPSNSFKFIVQGRCSLSQWPEF